DSSSQKALCPSFHFVVNVATATLLERENLTFGFDSPRLCPSRPHQKTPPFQKQRRRLPFIVNIDTTTNFQNKHDERTLIDLEYDPEIANALSKRVRMTFQPFHACIRKGVFRQFH